MMIYAQALVGGGLIFLLLIVFFNRMPAKVKRYLDLNIKIIYIDKLYTWPIQ